MLSEAEEALLVVERDRERRVAAALWREHQARLGTRRSP